MKGATIILYAVFVICVSVYGYFHPGQTWDVLGYVGVVLSIEGQDKQAIHRIAYQSLQESFPVETYSQLTEGNRYRIVAAQNYESFYQQLRFYHSKPLYTFLCFLVSKTGFDLMSSTVVVSILAFCVSCIIIFLWLEKNIHGFSLLVASVSLIISTNLPYAGRLSTPDSLSGALLLGAFYSFLERKSHLGFSILSLLAFFTRPDNMLLISLFLLYFTFVDRSVLRLTLKQFSAIAFLMISAMVLFFLFVDYYGWKTLFYHTFVENLNYPGYQSVELLFSNYITALAKGARDIVFRVPFNSFSFFLLIALAVSLLNRYKLSGMSHSSHYCYLMLVSVFIHFVLFPNAGSIDRFSLAQNSFIGIAFISQLMPRQIHSPGTLG